ncbi:hypothetical protein [Streptococcus agalactiae]|uniref:hypothetical protein n=1 Tax=Streptococcus agalactiae TaxID=1311 RepID=UPI0015DB794D|nr:hypothetical protein [Streptococcus agalactiae]
MIGFPVNTESTHDKSRHAKNILDRIVTFLYVIGQPISQAEKVINTKTSEIMVVVTTQF